MLAPRFFPQKRPEKLGLVGSVRSLGECFSGVPVPDVRENNGEIR
jgi:hypothetical protein